MSKRGIMRQMICVAIMLFQISFAAAEGSLPWTQPQVIKAAVEIGMREGQRSQFREAVSE